MRLLDWTWVVGPPYWNIEIIYYIPLKTGVFQASLIVIGPVWDLRSDILVRMASLNIMCSEKLVLFMSYSVS